MTRRTLLSLVPGSLFAGQAKQSATKPRALPARGEFTRFIDRVTENIVVRLTQPSYQSQLPEPANRFVSSREGFLVFANNVTGVFAPYRANLKTGVVTQLGEMEALASRTLCLDSRERELWLVDGGSLKTIELQRQKVRTIIEGVRDFHLSGRRNAVLIQRGNKLETWAAGRTVLIAEGVTSRGTVNPTGNGCFFLRQEQPEKNVLWFAPFSSEKPRLLADGKISSPYWRPDGEAVLFLRPVEHPRYSAFELKEVALDGSPERLIAETSQFAAFAPNSDGSVFVGASRSRAQPNIVLLLRSARREMVLCEHRASHAETVSPAFSPNSQRVYFQSDHEGQSAIYSVNVDRLVEQTEERPS